MSEYDHPESGDINYWADQCTKARRERDEALAEVNRCRLDMRSMKAAADRLRALLRECLPLVEAQQLAAPPGDTLVARLTAALEQ